MRKTILAVSGLVFGITACSSYDNGNTIPTERTPVASIAVTLPSQSLLPGQTQRASAAALDAGGAPLSGRSIVWQSSAPAVAAVDNTGVIAAVAPGATTISASSEGVTGQGALTVMAPSPMPVATVSVSPAASTLQITGTVQLTAVTRDAGGNVLTGRSLVWSSSNAGVASISSVGLVTAVSAGNATFSASSEGQVGTATAVVSAPAPAPVATVSVSPATSNLQIGGTTQLNAVTRDASGSILTGRAVSWTTANAGIASISSSGLVTAVSAGTTTLSATSEGRVGTASVTVTSAVVASVTVSLAQSSLAVGQSTQASATLRDAANNVITGRTVTWSSGNSAILTVSASGIVSAIAQGTATVIATSGTVSGNASATITPPVTQGPAPEPGGTDVILFQDNFDRSTLASLVAGYATRGDMLPITNGRTGSAIRFP